MGCLGLVACILYGGCSRLVYGVRRCSAGSRAHSGSALSALQLAVRLMHNLDLILTLSSGDDRSGAGYITHRSAVADRRFCWPYRRGPHAPGFVADQSIAGISRSRRDPADVGWASSFTSGTTRQQGGHTHTLYNAVATRLGRSSDARLGLAAGLIFGLAISIGQYRGATAGAVGQCDLHRHRTYRRRLAGGRDLFTVLVLVLLPAAFGAEKKGRPIVARARVCRNQGDRSWPR